jgi:hypothetical protein
VPDVTKLSGTVCRCSQKLAHNIVEENCFLYFYDSKARTITINNEIPLNSSENHAISFLIHIFMYCNFYHIHRAICVITWWRLFAFCSHSYGHCNNQEITLYNQISKLYSPYLQKMIVWEQTCLETTWYLINAYHA